jgi:hypothetical protein
VFAWSQLDIFDISDSVTAVSEGNQLNYCYVDLEVLSFKSNQTKIFIFLQLQDMYIGY